MRSDVYPPMMAEWVVGVFEGQQAKSVIDHADAGLTYIVLERGGNKFNPQCTAAFRRAMDSPLPAHLIAVKDPKKIDEYERIRKSRSGLRDA